VADLLHSIVLRRTVMIYHGILGRPNTLSNIRSHVYVVEKGLYLTKSTYSLWLTISFHVRSPVTVIRALKPIIPIVVWQIMPAEHGRLHESRCVFQSWYIIRIAVPALTKYNDAYIVYSLETFDLSNFGINTLLIAAHEFCSLTNVSCAPRHFPVFAEDSTPEACKHFKSQFLPSVHYVDALSNNFTACTSINSLHFRT
jgi:hypothetical protein